MLPTAATELSAAQLAHVFENGADFLMTSIESRGGARPTISPKPPLPEGVSAQGEPWLDSLTGKKRSSRSGLQRAWIAGQWHQAAIQTIIQDEHGSTIEALRCLSFVKAKRDVRPK